MKVIIYLFVLIVLSQFSLALGCIDVDVCTSSWGRWIGNDFQCYTNSDSNIETFESIILTVTGNLCDYAPKTGEFCVKWEELTDDNYVYLDTSSRSGGQTDYFCYEYYCDFVGQNWASGYIHDYNSVYDNPKGVLSYLQIDGGSFELCADYFSYSVTQTQTQSTSRDDHSVIGNLPTFPDQFTEPSFIASATGMVENYFKGTEITRTYFFNNIIPYVCYWEDSQTCERQGRSDLVATYLNYRLNYCEAYQFRSHIDPIIDGMDISSDFHGTIENYLDTSQRPLILRAIFPIYFSTSSFLHQNYFTVFGKTGSNYLVGQGDLGIFQMSDSELYDKVVSHYPNFRGVFFTCEDRLDPIGRIKFNDQFGDLGINFVWPWVDPGTYELYTPLAPPDCVCVDEDSDGDSQTSAEFDHCIYTTGYYDYCYDKWPLFKDVCDSKICVDAIGEAIDIQGIIDNSVVGSGTIDMKYIAGVDNNDFAVYDVSSVTWYIIDRRRANCDGENYDLEGKYGTEWVVYQDDVSCDTDPRNRRCDEDHDDELTSCFIVDCVPTGQCKVDIGNTEAEQCNTADDCWDNSVCEGQRDFYMADCVSDGSDQFKIHWEPYDKTCGGEGFISGVVFDYDSRLCSADVSPDTVCDPDHDRIWQEDTYPLDQCKITIPNLGCVTSNDCYNDENCNSFSRCGDCYSETISLNVDCTDPDLSYCTDSLGSACGGAEDYTCACCNQIDVIDDCLELGQGESCQNDSECHTNYYCTGNLAVPGICTAREIGGVSCDRDRMCSSVYGCNNESHCGECYSLAIEPDENCIDPDKPYCSDNLAFGVCNLGEKFTCDCCNRLGDEDCCLEIPKPLWNQPGEVWILTSCVGGYNCECEDYDYNSTYNITCIALDPGDNTSRHCLDCIDDQYCIDKYGLDIHNYCDGAYCHCDLNNGLNPPGCDTQFCFGLYPGGYSCDCDSECIENSCVGGICAYQEPVACITPTSIDDDHDDDFILNASDTIILNANCSTGDPTYPVLFSCWYNHSIDNTGFCYNNYSQQMCTDWCIGLDWVNFPWDSNVNYSKSNGTKMYLELVVGINKSFYYGSYPTTDSIKQTICFRGGSQWCGESCSDRIQNQDETSVDWGGVCGNCSDSIRNGDETEIDYGGICGSCTDGILNGYENDTLNETSIDWGGWCGNCSNGIKDSRIGELIDGYGGVCGDCYNDRFDDYLNETEVDYGGYWCGSCINDSTALLDYDWQFVKAINKSVPFGQAQCPQSLEVASFLFFFFLILVILGGVLIFFLILLLLWPLLLALIGVGRVTKRVYLALKTKDLNKISGRNKFTIR